ncbi:uncharacterized protein LOC128512252 isoform X2 [Clarias gariepinus]|uniref:uncharacterized protein LOC128512252 isoform X2 n=1 Tax=Clarias gariepinus TaxID=13013 RepID=UPI00234CFC50|nr:uncharacterized protein LOC128512252 isoform X2 [Clarias gariepinus]
MPRARKVKTASVSLRTRRSRGTKRSSEGKDIESTGIGGAASSRADDPPKQDNSTSLQTTVKDMSTQRLTLPLSMTLPKDPDYSRMAIMKSTPPPPMPLPKEPDYSRMCPTCSSPLKSAVVPAGRPTSLLQCPRCSTTPLCELCLHPCPDGTCTNQSCQVVSLLLTCDRVTKSTSKVYGCPVFRACPKCHNVMMHEKGCKYVSCAQCRHRYCFICLRMTEECKKDKDMYWSLTCSAPRAARQRFQT